MTELEKNLPCRKQVVRVKTRHDVVHEENDKKSWDLFFNMIYVSKAVGENGPVRKIGQIRIN
jgi:hypothetical protein